MEPLRKIVWDSKAFAQLENIFHYIRQQSPQNADNIKQKLIEKLDQIPAQPEKHPIDKYRVANKGDFRAFEFEHIRIAYKITPAHIVIVRARTTYQEPAFY
ncbi:MAG: hypothetical protein RLZZ367_1844 [Bacteroidota bacterium]|jgi:plasmid stabilization system protein ParE